MEFFTHPIRPIILALSLNRENDRPRCFFFNTPRNDDEKFDVGICFNSLSWVPLNVVKIKSPLKSLFEAQLNRKTPVFKSKSSYEVVLADVLTTLHKCITSLFVALNFTFSEDTISWMDSMFFKRMTSLSRDHPRRLLRD